MNLKNPQEYYKTDQGILKGATVAVWNFNFNPLNLIAAQYDKFDTSSGYHYATGTAWVHACPIQDLVEVTGDSVPTPVSSVSDRYSDVWVKAYATAGDEKVADDALAAFKVRETKGDFDKAVLSASVSVDPIV